MKSHRHPHFGILVGCLLSIGLVGCDAFASPTPTPTPAPIPSISIEAMREVFGLGQPHPVATPPAALSPLLSSWLSNNDVKIQTPVVSDSHAREVCAVLNAPHADEVWTEVLLAGAGFLRKGLGHGTVEASAEAKVFIGLAIGVAMQHCDQVLPKLLAPKASFTLP